MAVAAQMTFSAQILTLYPEMFPGPLGVSLAGRALAEGKWSCDPIQLRDFAHDKHKSVDDTPAGGGAGMVLRADVLAAAVDFAEAQMARKILPGTGRGTSEAGGGVQARIRDGEGGDILRVPLHHPADGSPPRAGEDFFAPSIAMTPRRHPYLRPI
jgi:tRNA (guanine37-N1)-methyltransferase